VLSEQGNVYIMAPIYVVRTALMNCTYPLQVTTVPETHRHHTWDVHEHEQAHAHLAHNSALPLVCMYRAGTPSHSRLVRVRGRLSASQAHGLARLACKQSNDITPDACLLVARVLCEREGAVKGWPARRSQ
jgi:hypothetical protein